MNMDFDMEQRLAAETAQWAVNHVPEPLDWHGLRTRLLTAYAVRSVIECAKPREIAIEGGSFDHGSARAIAIYALATSGELGAVNPTALADGNSEYDKQAAVAGTHAVGD